MSSPEGKVSIDDKEHAALTFARVVEETRDFFPEEKYRPNVIKARSLNAQYGINPAPHEIFGNGDGIGTKPELAERLAWPKQHGHFESLAYDVVAMVADDAARFGYFTVGIINNLDVNSAGDKSFVAALARGAHEACLIGKFPLLNGETAELGHRTAGWGTNRLNWNMTALTLINREKLIDGGDLAPGQPVVVLREKSIRSNGLTRARKILETTFIQKQCGRETTYRDQYIREYVREKIGDICLKLGDDDLATILESTPLGADIYDHIQIPWHESFRKEVKEILRPSRIYSPAIYAAQGGVDGKVQVPIVACAHISGGGVPLKGKRMVEESGLGLDLETIFPDPEAVTMLMKIASTYPRLPEIDDEKPLIDERSACEQWNRGVGFLTVHRDTSAATDFVQLAASIGYEAAIAGKVITEREIRWRGHTWTY